MRGEAHQLIATVDEQQVWVVADLAQDRECVKSLTFPFDAFRHLCTNAQCVRIAGRTRMTDLLDTRTARREEPNKEQRGGKGAVP